MGDSWRDWDESTLPPPLEPTADIAIAKQRLDEWGYVILKNHLSPEVTAQIRDKLIEVAAAERANGTAYMNSPAAGIKRQLEGGAVAAKPREDQYVLNLHNKAKEFQVPLLDETVEELMEHVMGIDRLISIYVATIVHPGLQLMGLHTDQWFVNSLQQRGQKPYRTSGNIDRTVPPEVIDTDPAGLISPAYSVQSIWMLTDFTEKNGATRIVPKSHLSGILPDPSVPHKHRSIPVEGPAGSVLVYDARMWHSGGEHKGEDIRYALHATFCAPMIRPKTNHFLATPPEVLREFPQKIKDMLGYKIWKGGIGYVNDLTAQRVEVGDMPEAAEARQDGMPIL